MSEDQLDVITASDVEVDYYERLPVVIRSRWRLAERIAIEAGLTVYLVEDDEEPHHSPYKYTLLFQSECKHWSVPVTISSHKRFSTGLQAIYTLLFHFFPGMKSFERIMAEGESSVSVALSDGGPDGGS